jgi:hypothetical protein
VIFIKYFSVSFSIFVTKDDFLDRSYWALGRFPQPGGVLVFKDKTRKGDSELWTETEARTYLDSLQGEEHHCIIETEYIEPKKEEQVEVEEERVY